MQTHRGTPHAVLVPWNLTTTAPNASPHQNYGSHPTPTKASSWWTPHATAGSSNERNYGGAPVSTLFTSYMLFVLLVMIVIAILENNDGGAA